MISAAVEEQARILALLYEVGKELTSILDLDELLGAIGIKVKALADYDLFNVMLLNHETRRLEHAFSLRYDERVEVHQTLMLGQGLCGTAAIERAPIRVDRVADDPRYIQCEVAQGVQSELVVPLIIRDRVLGVLDLESLRPYAFTEAHEHMLSSLASMIAIALENATLYDRLRRAEQRKKEDLERAREMQHLLLPAVMPAVPGLEIAVRYHPAQELGGDFYDVLRHGSDCLAVAVGDVAGKGSAAALLASLGIGILREHCLHHPSSPAEMLADINEHLLVPGGRGRFITLALAVYNPATARLSLASSGFPFPILVRNGSATPVEVTGVPLGLLPGMNYDAVDLQLERDDLLVFCSDGVLELTNTEQQEYGDNGLLEYLAFSSGLGAEQVAASILESAIQYAGDGMADSPSDDRTILVMRVSG
jgi:phosphoserine phosphatase RsbU/P